jgi:cytochrome subunit of sulfide dehydrogenase
MAFIRLLWVSSLFALTAHMSVAEPVDIAGMARTCAGCHGPDGVSPGRTIPSIAGLRAKHFADAMRAYRQGDRSFYVMRFIAKGLDDNEIDKLSKHFARLPFVDSPTAGNLGNTAKSKSIAADCNACHGHNGRGEDKAPRLAGQPAAYLNAAMAAYLSGERKAAGDMLAAIKPLSAAQRLHLSQYYASRH